LDRFRHRSQSADLRATCILKSAMSASPLDSERVGLDNHGPPRILENGVFQRQARLDIHLLRSWPMTTHPLLPLHRPPHHPRPRRPHPQHRPRPRHLDPELPSGRAATVSALHILGFVLRAGWRFDLAPVWFLPEVGVGYADERFAPVVGSSSQNAALTRFFGGGRIGWSSAVGPRLHLEPAIYGDSRIRLSLNDGTEMA